MNKIPKKILDKTIKNERVTIYDASKRLAKKYYSDDIYYFNMIYPKLLKMREIFRIKQALIGVIYIFPVEPETKTIKGAPVGWGSKFVDDTRTGSLGRKGKIRYERVMKMDKC